VVTLVTVVVSEVAVVVSYVTDLQYESQEKVLDANCKTYYK
jgi:hypothetical protein